MARRKVIFLPGHYYHVYNRGANRAPIFRSDDNYTFLLRRVKTCRTNFSITVIAYCLMLNHYHFLLRQDGEQSISDFMQAVFNSYTKAFNKAFDRSGTLFEGPFQAIHVNEDAYLIHLCRYIHRNPVDVGLVSHPGEWPFSNYPEWVGKRDGTLVDRGFVREHFPCPEEYARFVMDYASLSEVSQAVRKLTFE
ncbi:MAG: transposase [Chloroflexi bacterium]|nr:transposase [Chloroflexota bacterium]